MDNNNQASAPVLNTSISNVTPTDSPTPAIGQSMPAQPVTQPAPATNLNTNMQPVSTSATPTTSSKKKILVVDDEQDAKDLFAELLRTNPDYDVDTASDGHEALDKCAKSKFDLVLLDIVMPNLDGVDTLSQIKVDPVKYGNPIVIMLTNIGGDIAIQEALKLGAVGYKLKIDTEPDELLETVAKAFETQSKPAESNQQVA